MSLSYWAPLLFVFVILSPRKRGTGTPLTKTFGRNFSLAQPGSRTANQFSEPQKMALQQPVLGYSISTLVHDFFQWTFLGFS